MTTARGAWRQLVAAFLVLAGAGMIPSTFSVIAVPLRGEFHTSRMVLMLAMTTMSAMSGILMPLLGAQMDRLPLRRMMLAGAALLATGYGAIAFATSFTQVLVIFGLLIAPANVLLGPIGATVLLSRWFPDRPGRALGIALTGMSAGGFVFPIIVQGLTGALPWRHALLIFGIILFCWLAPAAAMVKNPPPRAGGMSRSTAHDGQPSSGGPSPLTLFRDGAFWLIACTVAIVTAGLSGIITNLASLAIDAGVPPGHAALLVSFMASSSFMAKLFFAALADRLGPRLMMFIALMGIAAGMACFTQASASFTFILLGILFSGLLGGLMIPLESYLVPHIFGPDAVGRVMGILSGFIVVAVLATPPAFGLAFDISGSYSPIFWAFCIFALAALLWLPFIPLDRRGAIRNCQQNAHN